MHRTHSGNGIFWPVILQDGEAVGNWSAAGGKLQAHPFRPDIILDEEVLKVEMDRYTRFFNMFL